MSSYLVPAVQIEGFSIKPQKESIIFSGGKLWEVKKCTQLNTGVQLSLYLKTS